MIQKRRFIKIVTTCIASPQSFLSRLSPFVGSMAASAAVIPLSVPASALAQPTLQNPVALNDAIAAYTNKAKINNAKVTLEIASLVENGNSVPVSIRVDSPMTETNYVQEIMLFAEKNPQVEVARFNLTPINGVANVTTRIRLATSQTVTAIAKTNDQQFWQARVEVIVTLAACLDLD
jgi:sulfur-oxidizing protein SoxY